MRKYRYLFYIGIAFILHFKSTIILGQNTYRDYKELSETLKDLQSKHPRISNLISLAKTEGGKDIWALEIGNFKNKNQPGLAILGGVDGSYISGPELCLRFAEEILSSSTTDSISNLLDSVLFYVIPNVSPDASEQYFKDLKYTRRKNARETDDDRDGRVNEDPYEDMNEDGIITSLRIRDPKGTWIVHPDDERVMIPADKKEGEKGKYILITEGVDNDLDKNFNEDGPGGITFNKNLPYKFEHFKSGAGDYPVSEIETKAVLDYLYEKWNVFAVLTFGPSDNLSAPQQYIKSEADKQIISGILESDATINSFISKKYNEISGEISHPQTKLSNGSFMQWAYFHYGRLSFSTPAFYIPEIKIKPDSLESSKKKKEDFNAEVNFMRWADSTFQEEYFLNWTPIQHPDFPDHQVEIGGLFPYVRDNPPASLMDSISGTHNEFIVWLSSQRPVLQIINIRSESIGKNLYRLEMDIYNRGYFPALSEIGIKTRWVKKPKISLTLDAGQEIISGRPIQLLDKLEGDSGHHLSWLVKEKGTVKVEAGAPQTGVQVIEVELK
jgi:hypothetical protein